MLLIQNVVFDAERGWSEPDCARETLLDARCIQVGFEYLIWDYQEEKALAHGLGGHTLALIWSTVKASWLSVVYASTSELRISAVLDLSRAERAVEPFSIYPVSGHQIQILNRDDFEDDFDPPLDSDYETTLAAGQDRETAQALRGARRGGDESDDQRRGLESACATRLVGGSGVLPLPG